MNKIEDCILGYAKNEMGQVWGFGSEMELKRFIRLVNELIKRVNNLEDQRFPRNNKDK